MDEELTIAINADTTGFETALKSLERQAQSFGTTLTGALRGAVVSGRSLEDTLRAIGRGLALDALDAGLSPLRNLLNGFAARAFSGFSNALPFAQGGIAGADAMFAGGGVLAAPAYFPLAGGRTGLAGEAGPEAILPLERGPDGRLGVAAQGGGGPVTVNVTISTPDVHSFRRSEAQVTAALARAVARGRRGN
ncbi:phage tail tape measure protein [Oricola thermophila]|uniref:Phage tail tape measure protein n=1 Tax=Oricola thermophila TaxID=2742145 RepID=A0A6N1VI04_9HYPH|nr:phage tail tape measure protein [Oricola thermophila]QKV18627.1 phage tail tape measure protein [Oricola thermophila]